MALDKEIEHILEMNQRRNAIASAVSRRDREINKAFSQLKEKVKQGETTGDPIRDFVIVYHNTLANEDLEKPYRELAERAQAGQPVMLVERSKGGRTDALGGRFMPRIDIDWKLGILAAGLEFDIKKGNIIFPMEKYVSLWDREFSRMEWSLADGPISMGYFEIIFLGKNIGEPLGIPGIGPLENSLHIYFGKEVEQQFMCNGKPDTSYVQALKLLGHEAPEAFMKQYAEERQQQKMAVLTRLEDLAKKRTAVDMKNGWQAGNERKHIIQDIRQCLTEAVGLGMHNEKFKYSPRSGVEVDVPAYITALCGKYRVEIK